MSHNYDRSAALDPTKDNSYGNGYFPLPERLARLGRFADSLRPERLLAHKYFVHGGEHMLVARVDAHLSIMAMDLRSLLKLGLMRIQCNDPGTLSFYFRVDADPVPEDL